MAARVVIGNHKGGSGKTSTTVNLAAALAEAGHRVLVVDMDPQANASRRLRAAIDPQNPTLSTAEIIKDGGNGVASQAMRPCGWDGRYADSISVIPSRFDLENRISEAGAVGAVLRLRRALSGVDDDFDFTLMDCPPSLGHLTQLALAAARYALGTLEPEYDSIEGAIRYRDFINSEANREALSNLELTLIGWVVGRVRANLGAHGYQLEGLNDLLGADLVWTPHIPERAAIKDAADGSMPLREVGNSVAQNTASLFADLGQRLSKVVTA